MVIQKLTRDLDGWEAWKVSRAPELVHVDDIAFYILSSSWQTWGLSNVGITSIERTHL
jgi:hypothetical protein